VIDRVAGVIENIARVQPDSFQAWGQALVDGWGENSQQSVFVCGLHRYCLQLLNLIYVD
jgi:hypothetical protein